MIFFSSQWKRLWIFWAGAKHEVRNWTFWLRIQKSCIVSGSEHAQLKNGNEKRVLGEKICDTNILPSGHTTYTECA